MAEEFVLLKFSESEKKEMQKYAVQIIDLLAPLPDKMQYNIIENLFATFPKKRLLKIGEKNG
jgi:hypothetical protein